MCRGLNFQSEALRSSRNPVQISKVLSIHQLKALGDIQVRLRYVLQGRPISMSRVRRGRAEVFPAPELGSYEKALQRLRN